MLLPQEQARARIPAGSSKRTIAKKFKHRRSELVAGLQPAGGGVTKGTKGWYDLLGGEGGIIIINTTPKQQQAVCVMVCAYAKAA